LSARDGGDANLLEDRGRRGGTESSLGCSTHQWAPPPLVDLALIDRLLKAFFKAHLRLPAQTMNLVAIQRVSEVVAGTIACEPYDRIRKQWITKNLLGDLDVLSLVSSADVVDLSVLPLL